MANSATIHSSTAPIVSLLHWNGTWDSPVDGLTINDVVKEPLEECTGVKIYFLPHNKLHLQSAFRGELVKYLPMPKFFWTETAHEANGFFGSKINPIESVGNPKINCTSYSTHLRFLIKEIKQKRPGRLTGYGYDWQFVAFYSLWYAKDGRDGTLILLCFASPAVQARIKHDLQSRELSSNRECPFGPLDLIIESITMLYDKALWDFRIPVRNIERGRIRSNFNRDDMNERYENLHELSRHIIHKRETLEVAVKTLHRMVDEHYNRCGVQCVSTQKSLEFWSHILGNFRQRAQAFEQRIQNETVAAYHLFDADDNETTKNVLESSNGTNATSQEMLKSIQALLAATKDDGRELTDVVSVLTLLFLPGAFFSGFFGMNFFALEGDHWVRSRYLWVFFVTTVPVTITALGYWFFGVRRRGPNML